MKKFQIPSTVMDNLLISVLIPAYNVTRYLPDCLDSIFSQSERRIEVVVVNDGSTDETGEILKRYAAADGRLRVLAQDNMGVAATRNRLLDEARGEWVYFCDADDTLAPGALARILEAATSEDLDVLCFGADVSFESEDLEVRFPQFKTLYDFACDFSAPRPGPEFVYFCVEAKEWKPRLWALSFRRDLPRRHAIRFLPGNIHEDTIFILELLLHSGQVARIADRLYSRRIREGSIMTTSHPREDFASYLQNALRTVELDRSFSVSPRVHSTLGILVAKYLYNVRTALGQFQDADKEWLAANRPCESAFANVLSKTRTEEEFQLKNQAIARRDEKIASLDARLAQRDGKIALLEEQKARRDQKIAALDDKIARREKRIALLDGKIARRDEKIAQLGATIARRDTSIASLQKAVAAQRSQIQTLLSSWSYRLGKAILAGPRFFLSLGHKDRKQPA